MIAHDPIAVRCSEIGGVGLGIGSPLARPGQSGVEQPLVTHTRRAAVLGQLLGVNGEYGALGQPAPGHLASLRSAFRYRRITARAVSSS